jgi:hypothetical protein
MWTETIKHMAEYGKGNIIFLDGSTDGMNDTLKQMLAVSSKEYLKDSGDNKKKN